MRGDAGQLGQSAQTFIDRQPLAEAHGERILKGLGDVIVRHGERSAFAWEGCTTSTNGRSIASPCNTRPASIPGRNTGFRAPMNYRFILPLMTTAVLEQTVVTIVRVTTTYRAVELGLSVVWLGVISAAIAILPLLLAVKVGRYIDQGNETRTRRDRRRHPLRRLRRLRAVVVAAGLLLFTALLGLGHLMLVISQQVLCATDPTPGALERNIGNYMVANAIGQGARPLYRRLCRRRRQRAADAMAVHAPAFIGSFLMFAAALMLRPGGPRKPRVEQAEPMPLARHPAPAGHPA